VEILEHIWSETLDLREGADLPPLASILSSLLAAPMICFTTRMGGANARPTVSFAGAEVMPGATLADVLFEEFAIEISDETIVLIEPLTMTDAKPLTGQELGQSLGEILVELSGLDHPKGQFGKTQDMGQQTQQVVMPQSVASTVL